MTDLAYRQGLEVKKRLEIIRERGVGYKASVLFNHGEIIMFNGTNGTMDAAADFDKDMISIIEEVVGIRIYMGFRFINEYGKLTDGYAFVGPEDRWTEEKDHLKAGELLMMLIDWESRNIDYAYVPIWEDDEFAFSSGRLLA